MFFEKYYHYYCYYYLCICLISDASTLCYNEHQFLGFMQELNLCIVFIGWQTISSHRHNSAELPGQQALTPSRINIH